jgi:hypothetical protein
MEGNYMVGDVHNLYLSCNVVRMVVMIGGKKNTISLLLENFCKRNRIGK